MSEWQPKKLELSAETIRTLDSEELESVQGGGTVIVLVWATTTYCTWGRSCDLRCW